MPDARASDADADAFGPGARRVLAVAALLVALGAAPLAAGLLGCAVLVHALRSPDRLLDLAYVVVFCALGAAAGR